MKAYQTKTMPELLKIAQKHFNEFIRLRDRNDGFFWCISCHVPKPLDQMQAGHYLSAGHNSVVRFDEYNVHGQCIRCNYHLHGNQVGYRVGIVNKIGLEKVMEIENKARLINKWDRYSLIGIIETYKQKVKELKKS